VVRPAADIADVLSSRAIRLQYEVGVVVETIEPRQLAIVRMKRRASVDTA
jgi:hypothetical protein